MSRVVRVMLLALVIGATLVQVGCCCCTWATPVRRNPVLDRLRNWGGRVPERSGSQTSAQFQARTDTRVFDLEIEPGASAADLSLRVQLEDGAVRWSLADPLGTVRWRETVQAPRTFRDTQRFPPVPGTWTLTVEFRDATGEYEIDWVMR